MSRRERKRHRRSRTGGAARPAFLALGVVAAALALGVTGVVAWVIAVASSAPDIESLKPVDPGATSSVYAADGSRLGFIQADILRTPIVSDQIPQTLQDATVAIEDRRFYEHQGVDLEGIVRAAVKNVSSGDSVQGGSTLTMQLVRNLYTDDRARDGIAGYKRKIREAKLAEELENNHPGREGKHWVLIKYVNNVPYGTVGGQTAVGVQAAARVYFDKPASELRLHEAAMIAGLPQAPSQYNPFLNPDAALKRRNQVLQAMADQGYIKQATADRAKAQALGVERSRYYTQRRESFFFDFVKSELIKKYGVQTVRQGGLKIYTTIDLKKQQQARAAIASQLNLPGDPSAAIVTVDNKTGYIRAMASSMSYDASKFNLAAQGRRQPGSTFKIMVLMEALRRGVDPNSTSYVSKPLKFTDPQWGPIDVSTYSNTYIGSANLVRATLQSDNSIYTQLDLDLGPHQVKQAARDMGIKSPLYGYPAEGLGGLKYGVTPLEMANAYATIASGGWRHKLIAITKVKFPDGRVDDLGKVRRHRAFSDGVTYEATKILKMNITSGTGTRANIGCPAGGKTGTTDDFKDAWFVGFTPRLTTSVWVGYPKTQIEMRSVHGISVAGGTFPAAIWGEYMKMAKGSFCGDFSPPKEPFKATPFFGKYARSGAPGADASSSYDPNGGTGYDTQAAAPDPSNGTGGAGATGGGQGGGFDPTQYESRPQQAPQTQAPAATPPPPAAQPAPAQGTGGATPSTGGSTGQ